MTAGARGKDRDICEILDTNASELEGLLGITRQTISKHIKSDDLFGVDEVISVASKKFPDNETRSQRISSIISKYFPDVLKYTKDMDIYRFSQYYVFGMDVYTEIIANKPLERFLTTILSNMDKFVLFACLPDKPFVQLRRWLERFQKDRGERTASFILMPCKLAQLTPIQILADPWSNDPRLIYFSEAEVFVADDVNRASALANALRSYAPTSQEIAPAVAVGSPATRQMQIQQLMEEFNSSVYEEIALPEKPFVSA